MLLLLMCTLVLNSVLSCGMLLVFEFLLANSDSFLCSTSAPHAITIILLDALQLHMMYFENKSSINHI